MNRDDDHLPFRQASRLLNEFQFEAGSVGLDAVGRDIDQMVTLKMLHRAALREPDDLRVSVNAVAASLQRPTETIRRSALALVRTGFCERLGRGVRRHPDFLAHPVIVSSERKLLDLFLRMLDGFDLTGFSLPPLIREQGDGPMLVAALDIYLSAFELSESRITTPLKLYLLGAVSVLNAADLTRDPVLGPRYGYDDTVPPDELRRPAAIRAIANLDGFPYSTLWRHTQVAERAGLIRRVGDGFLLSGVFMDDAQTSARRREKIKYIRRVLHDLAEGRYQRTKD